jgi:hypothetical protein
MIMYLYLLLVYPDEGRRDLLLRRALLIFNSSPDLHMLLFLRDTSQYWTHIFYNCTLLLVGSPQMFHIFVDEEVSSLIVPFCPFSSFSTRAQYVYTVHQGMFSSLLI